MGRDRHEVKDSCPVVNDPSGPSTACPESVNIARKRPFVKGALLLTGPASIEDVVSFDMAYAANTDCDLCSRQFPYSSALFSRVCLAPDRDR
jgi:hypothetical protein